MTGLALPDEFRRAMGRFATGVTVVTTLAEPHDHAMTANAVASVSLDPPLLLVSIEVESRFHDAVVASGVWAVNVLPASLRGAADWLATRGRPLHGQLARHPHHRGVTGVALLDDALAAVECRTTDVHPAGDHSLVIGEVVAVSLPDTSQPALVYYRGRFETLA